MPSDVGEFVDEIPPGFIPSHEESSNEAFASDCQYPAGLHGDYPMYADEDLKKVFIGGLSTITRESDLFHFFKKFGFIKHVAVLRDHVTGISRGFGFCEFYNAIAIHHIQAAQMKGPLLIKGRAVSIRPYISRRALVSMYSSFMMHYAPHPDYMVIPQPLPFWPYSDYGMFPDPSSSFSPIVSTPRVPTSPGGSTHVIAHYQLPTQSI